jgi:hypothetical protein
MIQNLRILTEISLKADYYSEQAQALGKEAAKDFGNRRKAQIKGLENIANSALKVTDVLDYVKKQIGRHGFWKSFGEKLKTHLEKNIREDKDSICQKLNLDNSKETGFEGQEVYLTLIREFIRQMTVHFEYELAVGGNK